MNRGVPHNYSIMHASFSVDGLLYLNFDWFLGIGDLLYCSEVDVESVLSVGLDYALLLAEAELIS